MWGLGLLMLLAMGPVVAVIFAVVAYFATRPERRTAAVCFWAFMGLTLPAVPMLSFMGPLSLDEAVGFSGGIYDSWQTPLGHGYYLTSIDSSDALPYLYLPGEVTSSWPAHRVGCAGRDIVVQSREDTSLYAHLTPEGQFRELRSVASLGPIKWSKAGSREMPASCQPTPPRWLGAASLLLFFLPGLLWLRAPIALAWHWRHPPKSQEL